MEKNYLGFCAQIEERQPDRPHIGDKDQLEKLNSSTLHAQTIITSPVTFVVQRYE